MDLLEMAGSDKIVLSLTRDELIIIYSSIGETLELIDDWEYSTRVGGYEKPVAERLLGAIGQVIDRLPSEN